MKAKLAFSKRKSSSHIFKSN